MKKTFKLSGLYCPSCAMQIEGLEDKLPGIKNINVDFPKSLMEVEYNETELTEEKIKEAVSNEGYEAESVPTVS